MNPDYLKLARELTKALEEATDSYESNLNDQCRTLHSLYEAVNAIRLAVDKGMYDLATKSLQGLQDTIKNLELEYMLALTELSDGSDATG